MINARYIFYRILGNDLPPRHRKGQTLANLKIILDREPAFKDVEKRWIVNRIVDPQDEQKIIKLLEKYAQKYQVIPFDRKKFKKIPQECFKERLNEMIGLNGARNLALREGKHLGRWVLVFDGSCFFIARAWQEIVQACLTSGDVKYIIVPMMRIVRGGKGVSCEPQIIFRNDSKDEFDESFGYGQDSKVDLLRRLGVPGAWDECARDQKELSLKRRSKEFGVFATAGHVWRLPSGNEGAERDCRLREGYRNIGIILLMNKADNDPHRKIRTFHWAPVCSNPVNKSIIRVA